MRIKEVKVLTYYCDICQKKHQFDLDLSLFSRQTVFPFRHIFTHKNPSTQMKIITILYLEKDYSIIEVKTKPLNVTENNPLLKEFIELENHYRKLKQKYEKSISELKREILNI